MNSRRFLITVVLLRFGLSPRAASSFFPIGCTPFHIHLILMYILDYGTSHTPHFGLVQGTSERLIQVLEGVVPQFRFTSYSTIHLSQLVDLIYDKLFYHLCPIREMVVDEIVVRGCDDGVAVVCVEVSLALRAKTPPQSEPCGLRLKVVVELEVVHFEHRGPPLVCSQLNHLS